MGTDLGTSERPGLAGRRKPRTTLRGPPASSFTLDGG